MTISSSRPAIATLRRPSPLPMPARPQHTRLVIGIGNPLRGDDGVGALLAEQAGGRSVHQLTPELAAELA